MNLTWSYTVHWIKFPNKYSNMTSSGWETPEEAKKAALEFAAECGWTPRRWWQFWRWREPNPHRQTSACVP